MRLFKVLTDVVEIPLRIVVDTVKLPGKITNGEDGILENTIEGIKKIEEDLNE